MNPKFFDVKKEKQDAIINACLKVFTENGYKNASTDVIVKTAGISKGLLFHYFESKKGTYEFIYDYSVKYMMLELTQSVKKNERDFFEIQRTIEGVKIRVMRNYPYMQQFLDSIRFEDHPDALAAIGDDRDVLRDTYNSIYKQADMGRFDEFVDINRVINMISWMSEGFIKDRFRQEAEPDLDEMNMEFTRYLIMLRDHLYKPGVRRTTFIKPLEPGDGNRITMGPQPARERDAGTGIGTGNARSLSQLAKQLNKAAEKKPVKTQAELSFEERLAIKDTSVFGVPVPPKQEKKQERKEDKKEEQRAGKEPEKQEELPKAEEIKKQEELLKAEEIDKQDKPQGADGLSKREKLVKDKNPEKQGLPFAEERASETEKKELSEEPLSDNALERAIIAQVLDNGSGAEAESKTESQTDLSERDEAKPEASEMTEPINAEKEEEKIQEALIEESAEIGEKISINPVLSQAADSDMVDLSALYSKRLEEAVEELGVSISDDGQPKGEAGGHAALSIEGETGYENGYYGFMPDEESALGYGMGQGYYPEEGYINPFYNEAGQMFMNSGSQMYGPDMYEDDSAAYAELYNSVNNYDVNGATQEMPVNEVLAYRNAFTNEYIKEELSKVENKEQENKKEKKPKKKSFFSGLFGKKNGATEEEEDRETNGGTDHNINDKETVMPQNMVGTEGAQGYMPEGYVPEGYVTDGQGLNIINPEPQEYSPEMVSQIENYQMPVYYDTRKG